MEGSLFSTLLQTLLNFVMIQIMIYTYLTVENLLKVCKTLRTAYVISPDGEVLSHIFARKDIYVSSLRN